MRHSYTRPRHGWLSRHSWQRSVDPGNKHLTFLAFKFNRKVRFRSKSSRKKSGKAELGHENVRPSTVRVQTAREAKHFHSVKQELSEVKDQLGRIEDRRVDDVGRLEQKIENSHVKLENLLINILKKDSKRKEREEQRDRDKH
jgi:hypothetical protein